MHSNLQSTPSVLAGGADAVAAALREAFPEYRRRQTGAFRKLVARALGAAVVTGGGGAAAGSDPVRRSDAAVVSNGAAAAAAAAAAVATANDAAMNADSDSDCDDFDNDSDDSEDDDDESSSGSGEDDDDDDEEEEAALAAAEAADADNGNAAFSARVSAPAPAPSSNPLNAALLSAYAAAPKEAAGPPSNPAAAAAPAIAGGSAFAPRAAVAAAAARALAAEAAAAAAHASKQATAAAAAVSSANAGAAASALAPATQLRKQQQLQSRGVSGGGSAKKRARLSSSGRARGGAGAAATPTGASLLAPSAHHQFLCEPRAISFDDLGGLDPVLASLRELVEYPLSHPEVYAWLGVDPPRGLLLHGPPGCGKTALAHAVARRAGVPFLRVAAPEVVAGVSGESEAIIRGLFASAAALAPCVVFIDEIDAIAPRRESAQREMERRIVAQLLTCMDDLASQAQLAREAAKKAGEEGGGGEEAAAAADGDPSSQPPPSTSPSTLAAVSDALRRHVVVIGATNRPDALDPALRRAGRFDREIALPIPTEAGRAAILRVLTRGLRLSGRCDVEGLAARTPGYVGADLEALAKEAAASAATRIFARLDGSSDGGGDGGGGGGGAGEGSAAAAAAAAAAPLPMEGVEEKGGGRGGAAEAPAPAPAPALAPPTPVPSSRLGAGPLSHLELATLSIEPRDFEAALSRVQPAVRREGFSSPPAVSWDDVGALQALRSELEYAITRPIADPSAFAALGLSAPTGVLLYGPPGCGKTLLARAVAAEARANFISVKGPELLSKYVGESEAAVRRMFARAASAAPCVLFFDELDALAPRRGRGGGGEGGGGGGDSGGAAAERVVNQLLTEMDGLASRGAVFLVGATNRPDIIDPALLRPGRLDKALYVPLPDSKGREDIMRRLTRRTPLAPGSDPCAVAASAACEGFSGADLASLVREAGVCAIREAVERADREGGGAAASAAGRLPPPAVAAAAAAPPPQRLVVRDAHFRAALRSVGPSVSKRDVRVYDALRSRLAPKPLLVEEDEGDEERGVKEGQSGGGDGK